MNSKLIGFPVFGIASEPWNTLTVNDNNSFNGTILKTFENENYDAMLIKCDAIFVSDMKYDFLYVKRRYAEDIRFLHKKHDCPLTLNAYCYQTENNFQNRQNSNEFEINNVGLIISLSIGNQVPIQKKKFNLGWQIFWNDLPQDLKNKELRRIAKNKGRK